MESNWKFYHVGVVVRDLEEALEYYKSLGIVTKFTDRFIMEGKKAKLVGRWIYVGSLAIELWQPISGETVQKEFLDIHGEGINHIAFWVDDIDKERAKMAEKGIPVVFSVKREDTNITYYDTREVGNVLTELCQASSRIDAPNDPRGLS